MRTIQVVLAVSSVFASHIAMAQEGPPEDAVGAVRPVEVVNTVPVVVTELPTVGSRTQTTLTVEVGPGESAGCTPVTLPADKRIVVNQISGDVRVPVADDQRAIVVLQTKPNTGVLLDSSHYFPLTAVGTNISVGPQAQTYVFNEQPNIFHDASLGPLQVCLSRGPTPSALSFTAFGRITVSGVLTDLP